MFECGPEHRAAQSAPAGFFLAALICICEPVVGATLGAVPAVPGYLKRIREICDQYGILLVLDELMCGGGGPAPCAAGLAVQHAIRDEKLLDNVRRQGEHLDAALHERFGNHPPIGDIRGRGLFRGLELVADRTSKSTFEPGLQLHNQIKKQAMERGLMCYPMGGTIDGVHGNHTLIARPYIIDEHHIEEMLDKLGSAVDAAIAQAQS